MGKLGRGRKGPAGLSRVLMEFGNGRWEIAKVRVMVHCGITSGVWEKNCSKCCHAQALLDGCE